jgi:hypothetical protein
MGKEPQLLRSEHGSLFVKKEGAVSNIKTDRDVEIDRRKFLKKSALGVLGLGVLVTTGKVIVSPPDMELLNPYPDLVEKEPIIPPYNKDALFFDEHQYATVATLAALIVPTDDDPGATEAGVVDYIDGLLAESKEMQAAYTKGLKWLDGFSREKYGKDFVSLSVRNQIDLLSLMHETYSMRRRPVSGFWQQVDRKIDKYWDDWFGAGEHASFFQIIRRDVLHGYFSNPISWRVIGYLGPPQPVGYLDFSNPPSSAHYTGSTRHIDNSTCLICHKEGRHPRGGMINHTCTACHRPHSPWPYDKNAFHLEDHTGFVFPNPDKKKEDDN